MTTSSTLVKDRQKRHWDTVAPRLGEWSDWTERNFQPLTHWLEPLTGPTAHPRILDLASGAGYPALALARVVGPGGRIVATDLSREMIAVAFGRARRERLDNIVFAQMDAEAPGFAESSFDLVTSTYGLMFCPDPQRVVLEGHRLLVRGGRIAVVCWAEPSESPFFNVIREAAAQVVALPAANPDEPGPFRLASTEVLACLLTRAGFNSIEVERLPMTLECDSIDEYCRIFTDVALSAKVAARLSCEADRFEKAVRTAVRPYVDGTRVRLVATSLRASGRK